MAQPDLMQMRIELWELESHFSCFDKRSSCNCTLAEVGSSHVQSNSIKLHVRRKAQIAIMVTGL
jgi:hypothetical protein